MMGEMPRAAAPLTDFARLLRRHGFAVTFEQTRTFLAAVCLLGPSTFDAIRDAAYACFAPTYDRRGEFEALFRAHFHGDAVPAPQPGDQGEARVTQSTRYGDLESPPGVGESGRSATAAELLFARQFGTEDSTLTRRRLRYLSSRLPHRRCFRMAPVARGRTIDLSRSLMTMVRHDGDVPKPAYRMRRARPRRILMLIDISGSMKSYTQDHLIFAHLVSRAVRGTEVFTIGTRLTRVSDALAHRHESAALAAVADRVADWDGGTRLGPGFASFISVARYLNYARGAAVLILSDGLERGDPVPLLLAVQRLRRVAWRLSWASPLVADPAFRPETYALRQLLPHLDDLVDGGSLASLAGFVLRLAVPPAPAARSGLHRRIA
jgi:uncharacterized protein with von Willebrand factor type A (vWA) domain